MHSTREIFPLFETQHVLSHILHIIRKLFFLQILFYPLSNDISKFCDVMSSILVTWRDNILKEIFSPGNYKLYFPQKLMLKIASDM